MPVVPFNYAQINAALRNPGMSLGPSQFTFSIPGAQSIWPGYAVGTEPDIGYASLTAAQADYFRAAIRSWDELIAPNFSEVADNATTRGEVRIAFTTVTIPGAGGYTIPGAPQDPGGKVGDIWLDLQQVGGSVSPGTYGYTAMLHEIGHTLGLKHPFEGTSLPDASYDNVIYSVMSYTHSTRLMTYYFTLNNGWGFSTSQPTVEALTPMVLDIVAVQSIYGADTTTRIGDNVYVPTQGEVGLRTIYDAGGNDTIDLSSFTRPNNIDLRAGAYSDVGIYTLINQMDALRPAIDPNLSPQLNQQIQLDYQQFQVWTQTSGYNYLVNNHITAFEFKNNLAIAFGTIIENAWGGSNKDSINGNEVANVLLGNGGDDTLAGNGGDDTLIGGAGSDSITGGNGIDLFEWTGTDFGGTDTITDFAVGEDKLRLFAARNFIGSAAFTGTAGDIRATAGGGFTTIEYDGNGDRIADQVIKLTGTLAITASDFLGIAVNGVITGTSGADILSGGAGRAYTLVGGAGNDFYSVDSDDIVVEAVGGGNDRVSTTTNYRLPGNAEVEQLEAVTGSTAFRLDGNGFANIIYGNETGNFLDGGGGADTLRAGGGNDTYIVDNAGDLVEENAGQGFDAAYCFVSFALSAASELEWLSAIDNNATAAINLTGSAIGQYLIGNAGANQLDGKGGADFMQGYGGNDIYYIDNGSDAPVEAAGGGFDTVYTEINYGLANGTEIEVLSAAATSATTATNLLGNGIDNILIGNNGANALDGAAGADSMFGNGGNDTYIVDSFFDQVTEKAGEGFDAIYTTSNFVLAAGSEVEWLSAATVGATTALALAGNGFNNYVLGNNGANVINGGGGLDILYGYGGADSFQFTTALGAGNVDTITDFVAGTDRLALDDAIFTQIGGLGALNANAFVTGTAAADASDRIVYNAATGQLFYDADGTGAGAAILFATLQGNPAISASDFMVI